MKFDKIFYIALLLVIFGTPEIVNELLSIVLNPIYILMYYVVNPYINTLWYNKTFLLVMHTSIYLSVLIPIFYLMWKIIELLNKKDDKQ